MASDVALRLTLRRARKTLHHEIITPRHVNYNMYFSGFYAKIRRLSNLYSIILLPVNFAEKAQLI
jgi:hypothetical protein